MTTTGLKLLALFLMTIDHIAEFNLSAPYWFRWIGRLSAPIFVFCSAIGFSYTRNRKKYILRMYLLSCIMEILNAILNTRYDFVYISNNIFSTLLPSCIIIFIIDTLHADFQKGIRYAVSFVLEQIIGTTITILLNIYSEPMYFEIFSALSINVFFNEAGILFVFLFILLYYNRNYKHKLAFIYTIFSIIYAILYSTNTISYMLIKLNSLHLNKLHNIINFTMQLLQVNTLPIFGMRWFSIVNYYWMVIFSLPFILLYNGKRGRGYKYFFYIYYPLHIYFLYFIFMQ